MVNAVRFMALAKDELNEKPQAEDKCLMELDCVKRVNNSFSLRNGTPTRKELDLGRLRSTDVDGHRWPRL